jgi:type II restriction/modification system DNA methylase subunit YeeA
VRAARPAKPAEVDPAGEWYTFEKGVAKSDGGKGWADVWLKGKFGWEYKGKHKDLKEAYKQLLQYREALENPPLLVVCDLDRFEVHTNFTGTQKAVHAFDLDGLADPQNLLVLRNAFSNSDALKPGKTRQAITEEVAARFARLAEALAGRAVPPHEAAYFLMKLMFCMFAEDIELLPRDLFTRTVANSKKNPVHLSKLLKALFRSMAGGEPFGADEILRFNGGLFADEETIDLLPDEIEQLHQAALADWSSVEPSIFGTLFERSLDPAKRSQIGAHYTSREDIETVLRPVFLVPLQREWEGVRQRAESLLAKAAKAPSRKAVAAARRQFERALEEFADRLAHVTVLDPACGSGNFLPNPNGRPNSDVIVPWINGLDVTRRHRRMWIIDFGTDHPEADAALYEAPFEFVRGHVLPKREATQRATYRKDWWLHVRPREDMRQSLKPLARFIATTTVSKHRLFVWEAAPTLPDHQLITFAFTDDCDFGVLHSRIHEVWALDLGTQVETRPRYTPTTCFETFPMPEPTPEQRGAESAAAVDLARLRDNWLNPPEWTTAETLEFPGSVDGPWKRYVHDADAHGIGTVRFPRTVAKDAAAESKLKARTLTNLYNERPTWLDNAHRRLDEAVFAAYGWPTSLSNRDILARLLALNLQRVAADPAAVRPNEGDGEPDNDSKADAT